MYTNVSEDDDIDRNEDFEDDVEECESHEFESRNSFSGPNFASYSKSGRTSDSSSYAQPLDDQVFHNAMNEHSSQSVSDWSSTFKMKKWNYKAILNDGEYPRIKISAKSRLKKSKNRKSRDSSHFQNDNSSPYDNLLKTRLKASSNAKSSRKKLSKQRKKLSSSKINNAYNGLSSANSIVASDNDKADLVPTHSNTSAEMETDSHVHDNHYTGCHEREEYAPQYLELKPSVKFKCCRCGTNDFSTMALLQEHIARCDGHPATQLTANSLIDISPSSRESRHSSVGRNLKIKRKVLLCSSCGTYYQHYNLYVHMRDTHNKEICLFCRSTFSEAQHLWDHLIAVHNLSSVVYSSAAQVRNAFKNFFITCCLCNAVFSDQDEFSEHDCKLSVDKKPEEPSRSSCEPLNESELERTTDNTTEFTSYAHVPSNNTDDETERSNVSDADKEPITADSTLNVIGLSEHHRIASLTEKLPTTEVSEAVDAEMDKNILHSELVSHGEASQNLTNLDERVRQPLIPENQPTETENPCSSPTVDVHKTGYDDDILPNLCNEPESSLSSSHQEANEPLPEKLQCTNDCQKEELVTEPITNENPSRLKSEENKSNWLGSDDEIDNLPKVSSENETAPPNTEPIEPPPQPLAMALMLDETVASLSMQTLIKECVRTSCDTCLYCNNAILITVNGGQLATHLRSEHRYMPTKPEDTPEQVINKIEEAMTDLKDVFMNASMASTYTKFDSTFACLQCSFSTSLFKELCHHKRKVHHKVIFLCIMCKCNFLYYSQLLCHLCPGLYSPDVQNALNYHCCFCDQDCIPSAFRLMVHLRKIHQACDICLTKHNDQSELFSHMIKQHKMNHLCYKCNLAYRSRDGINEHLFWKHGTESVLCKRCLQKKWPHAYHFCIPASTYTCEECSRIFTKAVALTVHRRAHNGDFPFACTDCEQRFISKKLLNVHRTDVHDPKPEPGKLDPKIEDTNDKTVEEPEAEYSGNDKDGKKRRKKKQKKEKTDIEKPLLDELPPLNLSSESDEDSVDEENTKSSATDATHQPSAEFTANEGEMKSTSESTPKEDEIESTAKADGMKSATNENDNDSTSKLSSENTLTNEISSAIVDGKMKLDGEEATPQMENNVETPVNIFNSEDVENGFVDSITTKEPSRTPNPEGTEVSSETKAETDDSVPLTTVVEEANATQTTSEGNELDLQHVQEISIERIRNCLLIEHSYCIPDSIFHSEEPDGDTSLEAIAQKLSSPKPCLKTREKSCCKSVTPRKRKRPVKRESSSSDSSSDSDSSSSSCGSNCSCNQKSNSNCSSSSSGSEYSTTPDKKHSKNSANETQAETTVTNDEDELKKEEDTLLNVRESDLETDIETSDEDFYDKYPSLAPRVEEKSELLTLPVLTMPSARPVPSLPKKETNSSRKNRKRRRAPKIKINVGPQSNGTNINANISINLQRIDSQSASNMPTYTSTSFKDSRPGIHLCRTNSGTSYSLIPNNISNDVSASKSRNAASDASGRRSKRERVKNKFYGYSSSDDGSGNEAAKVSTIIRKRAPPKRSLKTPMKQPFIGIRAKKPLIMPPKRPPQTGSAMSTMMASAHPSLPPHLYRMPSYIMQQQHQQYQQQRQCQQSSSSSDDSDSDNLVINEPSLNDRSINNNPNLRFPTYPPSESSVWPRTSSSVSTHGTVGPGGPVKNVEKLYCYCRCPYDEVSEMIGCDGENCKIEWFHFECVGIMVPPKGAWYCPQCKNREAVPQFM